MTFPKLMIWIYLSRATNRTKTMQLSAIVVPPHIFIPFFWALLVAN